MRRKEIKILSLTGKTEGKRAKGRQRMTYFERTNTANGNEIIQTCQEREKN